MTRPADIEVDEVVERLRGELRSVAVARGSEADGGLPRLHGIYAWWMVPGAISGVTGPAHPAEAFQLLYVGIAPSRDGSKATLRSRILGQHVGGNIGSSTFRQSLAALLFATQGWTTIGSGGGAKLLPDDNRALSDWQQQNLRLTWTAVGQPWAIEAAVISLMQPPLNLAGNSQHKMYGPLRALRAQTSKQRRLGDDARRLAVLGIRFDGRPKACFRDSRTATAPPRAGGESSAADAGGSRWMTASLPRTGRSWAPLSVAALASRRACGWTRCSSC